MSQYTYRKRAFLNSVSTGHTSYIYVEAESSNNGEYRLGNYLLLIADCKRVVEFEFFLGTQRHRRRSLAKADLLAEVVNAFRDALHEEAKLIEKKKRSPG